ncbi:hypothetical protein TorRG33x02_218120 [Trema orientale]|uniref:Transmembrane protein n=1 Tax=Trema orientale TaxID=63057 RepID=A0A2P5EAA3_TREOI|nr:hypothetical protein TorRG33x02_218120 [Trema orientale]
MSFHAIMASIISILATFIQTEFQSRSASLFDTHYWTMPTFFVVLFTYVVASAAQARNTGNDNNHDGVVLSNMALTSGALASTLLLLIIHQALGWVALVFWILYFVKTAYDQLSELEAWVQVTALKQGPVLAPRLGPGQIIGWRDKKKSELERRI